MSPSRLVRLLAGLGLIAWANPAAAWPGTTLGRLEAQAALQGLNVELLTHDSATAVIEAWCVSHQLDPAAKVLARRVKTDKPADPEIRAALQVAADAPVRYRRVQLVCGERVLSEADNWYVPSRLTAQMNRTLDETDTPFGRAVAALGFRRRTTAVRQLFQPLPPGWEMQPALPAAGPAALAIPAFVLEHRATLFDQAGAPFSVVVERYTDQVLAFEPPGR